MLKGDDANHLPVELVDNLLDALLSLVADDHGDAVDGEVPV
jgi:hypothetical protein